MKLSSKYLAVFEKIRRDRAEGLHEKFRLHCEAGYRLDSAAFKIQKGNWSDRGFAEGIFFSIWVGEKDIEQNRFNYNIHALKLGSQKSCGAKPVAFAKAFRSRFDPCGWPNIGTDHGPQTLMQGWMPLCVDRFENDAVFLIKRFVSMHGLIDEVLYACHKL